MKRRNRTRIEHRYSSDRPIHSDKEDRLERSNFAGDIANDVAAWHGDDSLVIALYGGWGCGKTYVKNLVLERLGKRKGNFPIIEFNPWQFSGTGNIASAFFKELRIALSDVDTSKKTQARADKLDRYAKSLSVGGTTVSEVGRLLSFLGVPGGGIVHEFGKGIKKSAEVAQEGSEALKAEALEKEKSVVELKRDLAEELVKLPQPVLVVIDDIDRLTTNEILEVFQLVKANADFPKLIYLLLFERSIVSKALNRISGGRGNEFLEKIVQVGYHVPHASREAVQKVLFAGLNEILATPGIDQRWDKHRWSDVYLDGIAGYFQNLRHVYRFLGSFDFHVHQFHSDKRFEVNPIDLIGLETLRVFEPAVYEQLAAAKRILTRDEGKAAFRRD
jgi:predicted KAP-like P-loop ATPase